MKQKLIVAFGSALSSVIVALSSPAVQAAESGSGAYLLGLRGPGAGVTAPPGLFFSNQVYFYGGEIKGQLKLEGGALAARVKAKAIIDIPTLLWVTPLEILGGRLGFSVTAPFGEMNIRASIGPLTPRDRTLTFADPSIGGFLGWKFGNLHVQAGVTGFIPIGDYREGALANVAKHRLAADPYLAVTWLEPTMGLDVSGIVGVTFNAANNVTKYTTGTELHLEGSISKKLTDQLMLGVVGYHYTQLSADKGPGAALGPFKGRASAVGFTAGYDFKAGNVPISTRVRYYKEIDTKNRLQGDALFLAVSMPLWVPQPAK
jgi:hypothetical protein